MEMILGCHAYEQTEHYMTPVEKKPREELMLPPKDKDFNRTIAYLTRTRGIDSEIVYATINQNKIYQAVTQKNGYTFQNCAFVGYDGEGKPQYCALCSSLPAVTHCFSPTVTLHGTEFQSL